MWQSVCQSTDVEAITVPPPLQQVVMHEQLGVQVGLHHFVIGWFVKSWARAMQHYGSNNPARHIAQLLAILWDGLCEPIWGLRNNILHRKPNPTTLCVTENLREKLYAGFVSINPSQ